MTTPHGPRPVSASAGRLAGPGTAPGGDPEPLEHRWNRIWALLPFALLAPASVIAALDTTGWIARGLILALAVALAGWHIWWILCNPQWPEQSLAHMAVYFLGAIALLAALRSRDEVFVIAVSGFFPMAFVALPGAWAYPGVVLLSLLTVPEAPRGLWQGLTLGDLLFPTVGVAVASFIGAMMRTVEREAIRRREVNARLVALADENAALQARLVEQARQAGVTAERARLARDMHDTVAQGLAGIVTQLETAEADPDDTARRLRIARDLARDSLVEVRRSVAALRPALLDDADLAEALAREVDAWRHRNDIAATFTVTGTPVPLDAAVDEAVLRVAQEALSNTARHAKASRLGVTLSYMEDMLVLDIRDDGEGFAVDAEPRQGFGLTAMRQRVEQLDGSVHIESKPGAGTAVSVSLPLDGDDQ
ncbi:sensor histidine kinase [Stackebrandtia nassauensis]|uniref:Oxygen sensor histidine kinase NreB n=1 Tax=Stackebrandtia nassauensis (strain DSM 44728 / CIP 108903 / NRRL B-16338 / NBRC 102104 / LLR-40K-21) TaxID=446470 RepID=D3Q685_STANL|nr:sensor histidine kinase [Stackebrandtia nassauensis]ADD42260.1 histidine kinase [Stackebrandtia nassauensis DSM 44728]